MLTASQDRNPPRPGTPILSRCLARCLVTVAWSGNKGVREPLRGGELFIMG